MSDDAAISPVATRCLAADEAAIAEAAAVLRDGGLAAFPTETVYGLGADATSDQAVARLFAAKGRPRFNPLIVHVTTTAAAAGLVRFDDTATALAEQFWPGPLTLVAERRTDCSVSLLASAGLDTLAVRAPDHPVAHALLLAADRPIAAPSANRSGALSPTTAAHVAESLDGRVDLILDGGPCPLGLESAVVDVTVSPPALLRPGPLNPEKIATVAGALAMSGDADAAAVKSPGQLERHYAPRKPIRLAATEVSAGEALIAFGPGAPTGARATFNLSPDGDLVEAAANFFAYLHKADQAEVTGIAVMAVPDVGLGIAINDRLRRAAAGDRGC